MQNNTHIAPLDVPTCSLISDMRDALIKWEANAWDGDPRRRSHDASCMDACRLIDRANEILKANAKVEGPAWSATVENGQPGDTLDTEKATADLIAAAPKMVAALQLLETWMGSEKGSGMWTAGYMLDEVIRPALREASGQNAVLNRLEAEHPSLVAKLKEALV